MCAFDTWLTHSTRTNSHFNQEWTGKRLNNSRTSSSHLWPLNCVKTTETSLLAPRQRAYTSRGKTWQRSESRDTMAAIMQGRLSHFWSQGFYFFFFFFWSQIISTRPLSCRKAMRLRRSQSAHESVTSGVWFHVALRLPFNTLNSLLAWVQRAAEPK